MPAEIADAKAKANMKPLKWLTSPLPLSWHFGGLVASIAIPAIFLGAYLISQQQQAQIATIERDAMARASAISHASDSAVISIISALRALGSQSDLAGGGLDSFVNQARRSFAKTGITVTLRDDTLNALKGSQQAADGLDLGVDDKVLAREALESGVAKVSDYSVAAGTGASVVHVWVPVEAASPPRLLLDAMIPAESFNATLLQSQLPKGWSAGLSDRHYRIIARTEDYERFVGQLISEDTRRNTITSSGIMRSNDLLGRPTMQAFLHSDLTGWRLSTWAPRSLIEGRMQESWMKFLLMAGALTALAAASAWLWARRMASAVTDLAESARRLESDRLLDDVKTPILEVNKLRDTISAAAAELIRRKAALAENEERLRMALDAGGMGVWEWDPETDVAYFDATEHRLTGIAPETIPVTGAMFISRIHPDDSVRVTSALMRAAETGLPFNEEFRFSRSDGSILWLAGRGSAKPASAGGRKRFVGVNFDISDEKEAAARTRSLLREVSHRSKNLLAVIMAIGRLTARDAPSVKAYERALTLRVGALAASQDLIVASNWQGVDLEALVRGQLNAVGHEKSTRACLSGPEVALNPTAAQNLGMAIAELGLNAIEHGALSNDTGTLTVSWDLRPPERPDKIVLNWIERNGPSVAPAQKRGYGLAVVERLVAQSLKAKADIQFAAEGVQWSLSAPLDAMVARHREFEEISPEKAGRTI